jgi:TRAP-type C4-dicarboxylate transport system substrate-binding protein
MPSSASLLRAGGGHTTSQHRPAAAAVTRRVRQEANVVMIDLLRKCALMLAALLAAANPAGAEPIKLRLAFFTSDRSAPYQAVIKPFMDAVNADARGLLEIELYPSGALGKDLTRQPQLVLDGGADIAFIVPGYSPELFPDNAVIELPGLFRNGREATFVFTRLVAEKALRGFRDFYVIGVYAAEPETFHGRVPMATIDDLTGKRFRVNNAGEAAAVEAFGGVAVRMKVTDIANALTSGTIDAAVIGRTALADFGVSRVATHHFFVPTSVAPLALVMNKKVFDGLPKEAQAIIQKYSGMWGAERFADDYERRDNAVMEQLKAETKREIVFPSASERRRVDAAFKTVRDTMTAGNPHYQSLLQAVENELENLRRE